MKKSLLAVAVVAALPVVAQAQSNVTMYGLLDASLGFTDRNGTSGAPGKATQVMSGVQSTNRWGVRGSEDLGGGLSAVFNLEGRVGIDDGSGTAPGGTATGSGFDFQRRAVVGLSGGFGTVVFGRDYTPGFLHSITSDQGGFGLWGTNLLNWTVGGQVRWSNGIHYQGTFGPIGIRAAYATGERDVEPRSAGNAMGISALYSGGPFTAHLFFHDVKDAVAAGATQTKTKQSGAGATFRVGPANLMLNYVQTDPEGVVKHTGVSAGANISLGSGTLGLQGHRIKTTSAGPEAQGTQIGINYVAPLSRRTNWYVSAGTIRNNDAGNFALRGSDVQIAPAAVGRDPRAINFGVRHLF